MSTVDWNGVFILLANIFAMTVLVFFPDDSSGVSKKVEPSFMIMNWLCSADGMRPTMLMLSSAGAESWRTGGGVRAGRAFGSDSSPSASLKT